MWRILLPYYIISILFLKTNKRTSRSELARLVMGTIFLQEQAAKTDMLSVVSIQVLCTVEGVANACI